MELPIARLRGRPAARDLYTWPRDHDGVLLLLDSLSASEPIADRLRTVRPRDGGSNLDAHHDRSSIVGAHAVEFSKTVEPLWGGLPRRRPIRTSARGRYGPAEQYSALDAEGAADRSRGTLAFGSEPPCRRNRPTAGCATALSRRAGAGSGVCRPAAPARRRARAATSYSRLCRALSPSDTAPWSIRRRAWAREKPELIGDHRGEMHDDRPRRRTHASGISPGARRWTKTRSNSRSACRGGLGEYSQETSPRASSRLASRGGGGPAGGLANEQQPVVVAHRLVGDAHRLAVDLGRGLGDPDVVAERLGHLAARLRRRRAAASSGSPAAGWP